jgi:asparagine synthase (glutamine-hydrolysing)
MCGIGGIINFNGDPVQESEIRLMMQTQKHRGPDDEDLFVEDQIGLGFVRLSILDLTIAGRQPMFSTDERYVIVFNGEIFNYIELREQLKNLGHSFRTHTDTEVLLHAYQEWGEEMLPKLNGMWAFVIYDRQEKTLWGSRDRFGIKPFYYYHDERRFVFASEIPPILSVLGHKPTADEAAIFDYLVFNRTDQTERTFFKEIRKLQHGHVLVVRHPSSVIDIRRWYYLPEAVARSSAFIGPEEYHRYLSSSIGLRLRSDVPVGVCLSGGLDSSSISAILLNDYQKGDLHTFSAVYGEGKSGDESKFIHLFKDQVQRMYFVWPDAASLMADMTVFMRAHAEPVPSTGPYAQFKVMELAKDHVTVTLDGQGADESLAGYHYFYGFYFKDLMKRGHFGRWCSEMTYYYAKHRTFLGFQSFLFFLFPSFLRTRLRALEKGYLTNEFYNAFATPLNKVAGDLYGSSNLQGALINHFEYKLEHLLKWEDRNSMWHSLEARVPFLDYRLVEKVLSLPDEWIIKEGMTKHILREAMKGTLPEEIRLRRDKMGFDTPEDEWFRTPAFQEYMKNLIHSRSFGSRRIIDPQRVEHIYARHLNQRGNFSKEIWKWIHLENWYREFID